MSDDYFVVRAALLESLGWDWEAEPPHVPSPREAIAGAVEAVLAALAPLREGELQAARAEGAREALDAALMRISARRDGHHYDMEPWDKGYRVGIRDGMEDLARQGASLTRAHNRADGVTGRGEG